MVRTHEITSENTFNEKRKLVFSVLRAKKTKNEEEMQHKHLCNSTSFYSPAKKAAAYYQKLK